MDELLTIALQVAFYAVFAVTLVRYLRRRTDLDRDVVLVFAAVAGLFATQLLTLIWPQRPQIIASAAAILLLAEPYLVLRLNRHFSTVDRRLELIVAIAFIASSVALVAATGNRLVTLGVVAYFVITSLIAARYLYRASGDRAGSGRTRLRVAAAATALLGLAILVAGAGAGAAPGTTNPAITLASRLLALLAALGYLAAFAPPAFVRRFQQRAVAYDLARGLNATPTGTPADVMWEQLATAAQRITGARAAMVAVGRPRPVVRTVSGEWDEAPQVGAPVDVLGIREGEPEARVIPVRGTEYETLARASRAATVIETPIHADRQPIGWLLAFVAGSPLFVEDDLALLSLLASQTARAIEREEALSERTTLVSELRRTNDDLARASAAKSDFLAAMSHELRTPLNSIIGFSELMLAPVNRAGGLRSLDVADWATHIHGAGLQLLDLINEVLDLAKIEAGRLELRYESFDLALLLSRTMDAMRPVADRRNVPLVLRATDPVMVEGDPARVRQIVYNLLSNAIKFSPPDAPVTIDLEVVGGEARVSVEDRGPGIGREDQLHLFEAFQQTERGRAQSEGTGLGLALARQLAERHGGRMELVSDVGAGSRFTLVLPMRRQVVEAKALRGTRGPVVLVIEDDPASGELLRAYLEPDGYEVEVVRDGDRGLAAIRRLHPAAVILDILLPGIDGWEVMSRVRSDPVTRDIPILVVSLVDDAELGMALGAVDFFTKPVDRGVLLSRLKLLLDGSAPAPGRPAPLVLAIDDETAVLDMYRAMLEPSGYRFAGAASGPEGLVKAQAERPDVILLDLTMPDMDGFEVAAALHGDARTEGVPVLVVTAREITPADKERLNGSVTEILLKGEDAAIGLRRWLSTYVARPVGGSPPDDTSRGGTGERRSGTDRRRGERRSTARTEASTPNQAPGRADARRVPDTEAAAADGAARPRPSPLPSAW